VVRKAEPTTEPEPLVRLSHRRHRDDKWIDKVTVETEPRWKTSGLSGDEWRFSYTVKLWRKGHVLVERGFGDMAYAAGWVALALQEAAPAYQSWPADAPGQPYGDGYYCDNPGCAEIATWRGLLKKEACRWGHVTEPDHSTPYRVFCDRHKQRGDCSIEDSDTNYVFEPILESV